MNVTQCVQVGDTFVRGVMISTGQTDRLFNPTSHTRVERLPLNGSCHTVLADTDERFHEPSVSKLRAHGFVRAQTTKYGWTGLIPGGLATMMEGDEFRESGRTVPGEDGLLSTESSSAVTASDTMIWTGPDKAQAPWAGPA